MAKISLGIVGLPNVGKSTLFKIITGLEINVANYPFATIDPNVGVVAVPDARLEKLSELSRSKKIIPAVVEFYDIAGLVRGAHAGEGLGNQFLSHIAEVNAICHVVRIFKSPEIIHVEQAVDPLRDLEIVNTELILRDLERVGRRREKLESEARSGDKTKIEDLTEIKKTEAILSRGKLASALETETLENGAVKELQLLTAKPQIYLLNGREEEATNELKEKIVSLGGEFVIVDLAAEKDVSLLIVKAYGLLRLMSFFTTGEDETRAWTIRKGAKAPEAAGVIHTDFQKKFIRAEVIGWEKLLEAGGWNEAKKKGWLRLEGKDYVVQDGNVLEIRHG